jgi:hypothetical protein
MRLSTTEKINPMKRMMWMMLAMCLALSAGADITTNFVDTFENGSVSNSDSVAGFWTTTASTFSGNSVSESGGKLILQTKPRVSSAISAIAYSQIQSDFNFFTTPLVYNAKFDLAASGIAAADQGKVDFRITINDAAGANLTQSTNYFAISLFATGNGFVTSFFPSHEVVLVLQFSRTPL